MGVYSDDFIVNSSANLLGEGNVFFVAIVILYFFICIYGLVDYILSSYALYKIADNRKISNAWLAWIPVAGQWTLGSVVDYLGALNGKKSTWRKVLLTLSLVTIALFVVGYIVMLVSMFVSVLSWTRVMPTMTDIIGMFLPFYIFLIVAVIASSASSICVMICIYKIFENLVSGKAIKYILITLLVPLGGPICLFLCKDSKEGLPSEDDVLSVENGVFPVENVPT